MSKKKTHEEYVEELAVKNPNVEVLGKYIDSHTPILHRCKIDGHEWMVKPSNILHGKGCPVCHHRKLGNMLKKTHDKYVQELSDLNPYIKVLEQYIGSKTPILHYCEIHNVLWEASPDSVLHGGGCKQCHYEKVSDKLRRTHDEYVDGLKLINPNIEVIGQYINARTPILHKCLIDGYVWETRPDSVLQGYGCPVCGGSMKKTHEQYVREVASINSSIKVIGEYINAKTPIAHRCKIDGYIWEATPSAILYGEGCPRCAGNAKKSHEEYVQELYMINKNIEVVGQYMGANTPILHRCKIDGCEWMASPANILRGKGCPRCQESKGERQARQWLEKYNITYIYQKTFINCKDKKPLPFDFYIDEYNLCIEFDGIQHFEPIDFAGKGEEWAQQQLQITQKHDAIKTKYCEDNNICLLRIPYFKNVEKELEKFFIHLI